MNGEQHFDTAAGAAGTPAAVDRQPQPTATIAPYASILLVALPFCVYVALVALLGGWIVDDAGISYAYARNVAAGHGFVSQPGRAAVEGFSNFLWVIALVPFFLANLFHPVVTAKVLSAFLVLLALVVVQRTSRRLSGDPAPGLVAVALVAAAPPIVIWTTSGLENALTLLLAAVLFSRLVTRPRRWEIEAGVLTALLAMNHPEGVVFLAAGIVAAAAGWPSREHLLATSSSARRYLTSFTAVFAPFLAFRLLLFGLPFPHTYYAKRVSPSLSSRLMEVLGAPGETFGRLVDLARGVAGPAGPPLLLLSAGAVIYLALRRRLSRLLGIAFAMQWVSLAAFLWLDADWMGEYRFGTLAILFSLLVLALAGHALAVEIAGDARGRRWFRVAAVALVVVLFAGYLPRIAAFAANPTVPFAEVEQKYALKFDAYADALDLKDASLLLADAGAPLYHSRLRVHDLSGLCEPDVIRTLKQGTVVWHSGNRAFHDWVFDVVRPTFINTHDFWTYVSSFESSPRFRRDYVAVNECPDEYVASVYGKALHAGDYVRRDALRRPEDLERLRSAYRAQPPPRPPLDRWTDAVRERLGRPVRGDGDADDAMNAGLTARYEERNPNRAATVFGRVILQQPDHYGATYQLASALDAANRLDEARPAWERVLALAEQVGDERLLTLARERLQGVPERSVDDSMREGLAALYGGEDPDSAVEHFRHVLERVPDHYGAHYQLAAALHAAGRHEEALAQWTVVIANAEAIRDTATSGAARATRRDDELALLMQQGLDALYARGEPAVAVARFRRVLDLSPTHYGATYQLAAALDAAGQPQDARPVWETVQRLADAIDDSKTAEAARTRLGQAP